MGGATGCNENYASGQEKPPTEITIAGLMLTVVSMYNNEYKLSVCSAKKFYWLALIFIVMVQHSIGMLLAIVVVWAV